MSLNAPQKWIAKQENQTIIGMVKKHDIWWTKNPWFPFRIFPTKPMRSTWGADANWWEKSREARMRTWRIPGSVAPRLVQGNKLCLEQLEHVGFPHSFPSFSFSLSLESLEADGWFHRFDTLTVRQLGTLQSEHARCRLPTPWWGALKRWAGPKRKPQKDRTDSHLSPILLGFDCSISGEYYK